MISINNKGERTLFNKNKNQAIETIKAYSNDEVEKIITELFDQVKDDWENIQMINFIKSRVENKILRLNIFKNIFDYSFQEANTLIH